LRLSRVALDSSQARLTIARQTMVIAQATLATARERAEEQIEAAQGREHDARAKAERMAELHNKKLASQEDCDTAQLAATQATFEVRNAGVALKELKTDELG